MLRLHSFAPVIKRGAASPLIPKRVEGRLAKALVARSSQSFLSTPSAVSSRSYSYSSGSVRFSGIPLAAGVVAAALSLHHFMDSFDEEDGIAACEMEGLKAFYQKGDVTAHYELGKELGKGAFGRVYKGKKKDTGESVAIKAINKGGSSRAMLKREIEALIAIAQLGGHENIVRLKAVYETRNTVYLITELVEGGELFDHLVAHGPYSEHTASKFIRQVVSALFFMHERGLAHKDLKAENLMLSHRDDEAPDVRIKLVDFGSAGPFDKSGISKFGRLSSKEEPTGTIGYMAPEMLSHKLSGPEGDMWALGLIIYILLSGMHPFDPEGNRSDNDMIRSVLSDELSFDYRAFDHGTAAPKDVLQNSDKNLKKFTEIKRKLKVGLIGAVITKKMNSKEPQGGNGELAMGFAETGNQKPLQTGQIIAVGNAFKLLDKDGKGYLTVDEIQSLLRDVGEDSAITEADLKHLLAIDEETNKPIGLYYEDYIRVMSELHHVQYQKGDIIFKEGEKAEDFYFLNAGAVEILVKGVQEPIARLGSGEFFGENGLLFETTRNATVRCMTDVDVVKINRDDFRTLVQSAETTEVIRGENVKRNMQRTKAVVRIMHNIQELHKKKGEVVIREGERGDSLYTINHGQVQITKKGKDGKEQELARLGEGDFFGETALLTKTSRNANVTCITDTCTFSRLLAKDFYSLLQQSKDVKDTIAQLSKERAAATQKFST